MTVHQHVFLELSCETVYHRIARFTRHSHVVTAPNPKILSMRLPQYRTCPLWPPAHPHLTSLRFTACIPPSLSHLYMSLLDHRNYGIYCRKKCLFRKYVLEMHICIDCDLRIFPFKLRMFLSLRARNVRSTGHQPALVRGTWFKPTNQPWHFVACRFLLYNKPVSNAQHDFLSRITDVQALV